MIRSNLHLEKDGVTAEQLELVHLGHGEGHHGVVIVDRVLDNQTVGPLLLVQDGGGELISEEETGSDLTRVMIA